jgi:hypothetical protein
VPLDEGYVHPGFHQTLQDKIPKQIRTYIAKNGSSRPELSHLGCKNVGGAAQFKAIAVDNLLSLAELWPDISAKDQIDTHIRYRGNFK